LRTAMFAFADSEEARRIAALAKLKAA